MKFPLEYPFKRPDVMIVDLIYHPNIMMNGKHCCRWELNHVIWVSLTSLIDLIKGVIAVIDHLNSHHYGNRDCGVEFEDNYAQFYEKALRCTLHHGRPRF